MAPSWTSEGLWDRPKRHQVGPKRRQEATTIIGPHPTGDRLGVCPGRRGRPKYLSKLRYWKNSTSTAGLEGLEDWKDWRTGARDLTRCVASANIFFYF